MLIIFIIILQNDMLFCAVLKSKLGKLYFCYAFVNSECTPTDGFFVFLSFVNTIELEIDSYLCSEEDMHLN